MAAHLRWGLVASLMLIALAVVLLPGTVGGEWTHPGGTPANERAVSSSGDVGSWAYDVNVEVDSQLVYSEGLVYFSDAEGRLHAFDPEQGEREWVHDVGGSPLPSPIISNDLIIVGSRDSLVALDRSGEVVWTEDSRSGIISTPTVKDDVLYFVDGDSVRGLNVESGESLWDESVDVPTLSQVDSSEPESVGFIDRHLTVSEEGIYFVGGGEIPVEDIVEEMINDTRQDQGSNTTGSAAPESGEPGAGDSIWDYLDDDAVWLESLGSNGEENWRTSDVVPGMSPAVGGGLVYVGDMRRHRLYALDAGNGDVEWSEELAEEPSSNPVYSDDVVYVGTRLGEVHAFDAGSGHSLWSVEPPVTSPRLAVSDGFLFVTSSSQRDRAHVFSVDDGSPAWNVSLDTDMSSTATAVDSSLVFGAGNSIYAVEGGDVRSPEPVLDEFYDDEEERRPSSNGSPTDMDQEGNDSENVSENDSTRVNQTNDSLEDVDTGGPPSLTFIVMDVMLAVTLLLIVLTAGYMYVSRGNEE